MQDIRGQMWLEGKGRRQLHTDLSQMWDLTSTFLSLSFPHTLLTFSLPGARSWNVQVSLIYPRKLGLIWNQGTSSLSLSSAEIIGIRHFSYHPAFPGSCYYSESLRPLSGLSTGKPSCSYQIPSPVMHIRPQTTWYFLWLPLVCSFIPHSFNKYFYFLKF